MIKDVIIHNGDVGKEMARAASRVALGSLDLPALFAPDRDAARRFIEFFTANPRNPNTRRAYARRGRIRPPV